jgi:hypothetical protein
VLTLKIVDSSHRFFSRWSLISSQVVESSNPFVDLIVLSSG